MSYSKLIKILRQTESKSGTGQRFSEKETDSRAQIVIGPKAEMVVTQRAKNASLTKIWLPKQKIGIFGQNAPVRTDFGPNYLPDIVEQSAQNKKGPCLEKSEGSLKITAFLRPGLP